ncbi:serine/threonine-protein kinase [Haliangium sp.]|uniref:serine/threonine-protein kinase n=1 Tax=Haliangium sp. TaxID=2663208 RepID=UPI003D0D69DF
MEAPAGIQFGKYRLLERLARGGMAEVFLARQQGPQGFDRRVAIKRILPHLAGSEDFLRMFLEEARLAASLSHPNVVHIYELGKAADDYYIAMEYIDGVHAGALIERGAREQLPAALVARIGADACAGLNYVHNAVDSAGQPLHLVHRDISPPNLMISYDGVVKLMDFGIAKAAGQVEQTKPGIVKGKFAYMSPEQTTGETLDGRSDVFSLALILWELLAGRVALPRTDPVEAMTMIRDGRIMPIREARPNVPPALEDVLAQGLAVERGHRPSAAELGNALEGFIKSSPELGTSMQLSEWIRRRFPHTGRSGDPVDPTGLEAIAPGAQRDRHLALALQQGHDTDVGASAPPHQTASGAIELPTTPTEMAQDDPLASGLSDTHDTLDPDDDEATTSNGAPIAGVLGHGDDPAGPSTTPELHALAPGPRASSSAELNPARSFLEEADDDQAPTEITTPPRPDTPPHHVHHAPRGSAPMPAQPAPMRAPTGIRPAEAHVGFGPTPAYLPAPPSPRPQTGTGRRRATRILVAAVFAAVVFGLLLWGLSRSVLGSEETSLAPTQSSPVAHE